MSAVPSSRISDDLRYELVDAARIAETSNRPRTLLVLATLLFLAAGIALIVALGERDDAVGQYRAQADRQTRVEGLALQFAAVERQGQTGDAVRYGPIPNLFSLIEEAASAAGLGNKPPIPDPRADRQSGAVRYLYPYTMTDPSLEALLAWVQEALARVPGLAVSSIEIRPQANNWQLKVTFVRWERSS